ncbi:MAG: hypothetical protein GX811_06005 [Lentisphaerae bacterium]|nr:hypothetical protein [Lentisphaerota bacterium]
MTRRKFFIRLINWFVVIFLAIGSFAIKAPAQFVKAVRSFTYPGKIKKLGSIDKPGKWAG